MKGKVKRNQSNHRIKILPHHEDYLSLLDVILLENFTMKNCMKSAFIIAPTLFMQISYQKMILVLKCRHNGILGRNGDYGRLRYIILSFGLRLGSKHHATSGTLSMTVLLLGSYFWVGQINLFSVLQACWSIYRSFFTTNW